MAWDAFSAESCLLHSLILKLTREGRTSDAIAAIKAALDKAHRDGPSNMTYADFERAVAHIQSNPRISSMKIDGAQIITHNPPHQ